MKSISNNKVMIIGVIVPCIAHIFIGCVSSEWSQATLSGFDVDDPEVFGAEESLARFGRRIIFPNDTDYNPNATMKELNAAYFTAKADWIYRNSTTPGPPVDKNAPAAGDGGNDTAAGNGTADGSTPAPAAGDGASPEPPADPAPAGRSLRQAPAKGDSSSADDAVTPAPDFENPADGTPTPSPSYYG